MDETLSQRTRISANGAQLVQDPNSDGIGAKVRERKKERKKKERKKQRFATCVVALKWSARLLSGKPRSVVKTHVIP